MIFALSRHLQRKEADFYKNLKQNTMKEDVEVMGGGLGKGGGDITT